MIPMDTLIARLKTYKPRRLPGRRLVSRCGVILLIADHGPDGQSIAPSVLMMKRAERKGDPWSGHVSFPGGRVDHADASTRAAALRELQEETGFDPGASATPAEPLGRLSDLLTREHGRPLPMVVSPYVYRTRTAVALRPSKEAAELWWVPLSHLIAHERRKKMIWRVAGLPLPVSYIDVEGARLWGLSLMMTEELVRAIQLGRQK